MALSNWAGLFCGRQKKVVRYLSGAAALALAMLLCVNTMEAQGGWTHGGQQPIVGASVYLFAVGQNGPGSQPFSLFEGDGVEFDDQGNGYITTDSNGNFQYQGDRNYAARCPDPNAPVYLVGVGGNSGYGGNNAAITIVLALDAPCAQAGNASTYNVDERTTVDAAYSLASFVATSDYGIVSDAASSLAIQTAFNYAHSLDAIAVSGSQTVTQTTINTLADLVASCINTNDSDACANLFEASTLPNKAAPTNTWQAIVDIALQPQQNVLPLYELLPAVLPFVPSDPQCPTDLSISVSGVTPVLQPLTQLPASPNQSVTLSGSNFGTSQSALSVLAGGSQASITHFDPVAQTITVTISPYAQTGQAQVFVGSFGSNTVPFTMAPPEQANFSVALSPVASVVGTPVVATASVSAPMLSVTSVQFPQIYNSPPTPYVDPLNDNIYNSYNYVAGVIPVQNWNIAGLFTGSSPASNSETPSIMVGLFAQIGSNQLVNSQGVGTTLGFTYSGFDTNDGTNNASFPQAMWWMNGGVADQYLSFGSVFNRTGVPETLTISGLDPTHSYSLIAYVTSPWWGNNGSNPGSVSAGGTTYYIQTSNTLSSWIRATSINSSSPSTGNYVEFTNLVGSASQTVIITGVYVGLAGFQIVDNGLPLAGTVLCSGPGSSSGDVTLSRNGSSGTATLALGGLLPGADTIGCSFDGENGYEANDLAVTEHVLLPLSGPGGGTDERTITIHPVSGVTTDLDSFPALITGGAYLATIANGGNVLNANGYDIVFTSDAAGTHLLDHEIDNYNPVTGAANFWVRIPTLSHSTDTTIYMFYGIPNVAGSLENVAGVWQNNYLSVYHLGDGSSPNTNDSASTAYNLVGSETVGAGKIGGGAEFYGNPSSALYRDSVAAYPSGQSPVTIEAWAQMAGGGSGEIAAYGANAFNGSRIGLGSDGSNLLLEFENIAIEAPQPLDGQWHQMVGVYGGGSLNTSSSQLYIDGGPLSTSYISLNGGGNPNITTQELKIGGLPTVNFCCAFTGSIDEVRVSSGVRSADWVSAEFANQSSPSTFYSISPQRRIGTFNSTISLSSSLNPTSFGTPVTLTATLTTGSGATNPPTGSISFNDGTTVLANVPISGATAVFSTPKISQGSHSITASYSGDANFAPSTSSAINQVVQPGSIGTPALSCAPSTLYVGGSTTCAVNLPPTATGSVTFSFGSFAATATQNNIGLWTSPMDLSSFAPGNYIVTYVYSGDTNYPSSMGSTSIALVATSSGSTLPNQTAVYSFNIATSPQGTPGSGFAANGNVTAYYDSVNGMWSNIQYDALNRLTGGNVTPISGTNPLGNLCWAYDIYGNRTSQVQSDHSISQTTVNGVPYCLPQTNSTWAGTNTSYDNANRISSNTDPLAGTTQGLPPLYDPSGSGNVVSDGRLAGQAEHDYLYDAEGRVCVVSVPGQPTVYHLYVYDAESRRVAKGKLLVTPITTCDIDLTDSTQFELDNEYVLGQGGEQVTELDGTGKWLHTNAYADGQMIATYDTTQSTNIPSLHFQFADWLGTRRVQTDALGNIEESCTSLPFGDSQQCTQTNLATAEDSTEHHFTGKERDTESGNDYFEARYYASSMGRFMSPDWSAKYEPIPYAKLDNPQSLNLYSYVLNNPLSAVDPDGHETAEEVAKKNVDNAKISAGTDRYDKSATVVSNGQVFTSGKDKCNLYVSETMKNSTGEHTTVDGTGKIPSAAAFADPNVKITGLSAPEPMANAKPGDVIAQDHGANPTSGNEEGHVGIVVSLPHDGQPGQTASANANEGGKVTINDWGFRSPTANPNNGERSGASSPAPVVRHPLGDQQ